MLVVVTDMKMVVLMGVQLAGLKVLKMVLTLVVMMVVLMVETLVVWRV